MSKPALRPVLWLGAEPAAASAWNEADLAALLPAAQRVLACGTGTALRHAYLQRVPGADWQELVEPQCMKTGGFDLIVVAQMPADAGLATDFLSRLDAMAAPRAAMVLCHDQRAGLAATARLALGQAWHGSGAPMSLASLYKLLLDAGWMPTLAGTLGLQEQQRTAAAALCALAQAQGMPSATAQRTLAAEGFIVQAQRLQAGEPALPAQDGVTEASFTVVVPTTRESQLRDDVLASPGLHEVNAAVVAVTAADSPAEALARALPHCERDWVLLCHQDVYFPRGFGRRLNALLAAVPPEERDGTLIGFAGMGVDRQRKGRYVPAGFVIDRQQRFDHGASDMAVSIDEFALVLSRRSLHRIDPSLGWHLWATDLCVAAICEHQVFPRIAVLPVFHNSWNDHVLPQAFHASAARLAAKYPDLGPIHTLCGVIGPRTTTQ